MYPVVTAGFTGHGVLHVCRCYGGGGTSLSWLSGPPLCSWTPFCPPASGHAACIYLLAAVVNVGVSFMQALYRGRSQLCAKVEGRFCDTVDRSPGLSHWELLTPLVHLNPDPPPPPPGLLLEQIPGLLKPCL